MSNEIKTEPRIKWGADEVTFEKKERGTNRSSKQKEEGEDEKEDSIVTFDIASYNEKIYDIKLKYPNMPVISTRRGFFPVEFLYQELARVPNANDSDKVVEVLAYHDKYAGKARMEHITQIKERASNSTSKETRSLTELLEDFHISIDQEPVTFEARRIPAPALRFAGDTIEKNTHNGSWNLFHKEFSK
jgi:hypothetical protein